MAAAVTVNDALDGHVGLDVECLDRIYLNGYVPNLQVAGQVVSFMTAHLGNPIPSPAIMEKIGTAFRKAVDRFAADNKIPVVRFGKDDRKIEVMRPYLARQARTGRSGVAAIGTAQEFQNVFASVQRTGSNGVPWFSFFKADRRVTCFYFYRLGCRFRAGVHQDLHLFPVPDQGVAQRPRVGQTPSHPGRDRVHRAVQRVRHLCGSRRAAGPLRPAGPRHHRGVLRTLDEPAAVAAHRARPRRGLLVGAVDAPGRGLAHPRVRRAATRPRVLRSPGGRQSRHRPPGQCGTDLPRAPTPGQAPEVGLRGQDKDRHSRHRGHRQRLLQELPHQAVLESTGGRCASRP